MPRQTRYRGRRRLARMLAGIGITILVVSALLGTAYLFLRDYVSLTDDGILLSLPFWNGKVFNRSSLITTDVSPSPSPSPEPSPDDEIVLIIEGTPSPSPSPEPSPDTEPQAQTPFRAVFLPQTALSNTAKIDEIAALCESGAVDAVVIEVKSREGVIATKQQALKNAVDKLLGKAQLAAYMSILQDNTVTRHEVTFGIKYTSGVNWLDTNKSRWINPFVPEARAWLTAQVSACAELPFDALLFDTLWFPPDGRLDTIKWGQYAEESRTDALKTLADELSAATELPCWSVAQPDALLNIEPKAGNSAQDIGYLRSAYDKLFVRLPDADETGVYEGLTAADNGIIPIITLPEAAAAVGAPFSDVVRVALGSNISYIAESAYADYPAEAFTQ